MLPSQQLLDSIDARLAELGEEIKRLEAARGALHAAGSSRPDGEAPKEPVGRPQRQPAPRRRRSARPGPVAVEQLERLLATTNDLATTTLAGAMNADRDQVIVALRQLEAAGRVRRTGQRRSTRWHLITDEERIAERAAQLQAQSRSAA